MNWKLKCLAFHVLNRVPFSRQLHIAFQRHLTGRYFQKLSPTTLATYNYHVDNFRKLPPDACALEFGAGRNLLTPLLLSAAGAKCVYAFDLERLATAEQVNDIITQLRTMVPGSWPSIALLDDLGPPYRIEYRAPGDARATGLPDRSIDFIYSTSTLEHIPEESINAILMECTRIATSQALFSFIVDYHDHYGTADPAIGRFHFYRHTDTEWRKFNPPNHYQNRLRHSDHERIFEQIGLQTVAAKRLIPPWAEDELAHTRIHPVFSRYTREDMLTSNGHFLLRTAPCSI